MSVFSGSEIRETRRLSGQHHSAIEVMVQGKVPRGGGWALQRSSVALALGPRTLEWSWKSPQSFVGKAFTCCGHDRHNVGANETATPLTPRQVCEELVAPRASTDPSTSILKRTGRMLPTNPRAAAERKTTRRHQRRSAQGTMQRRLPQSSSASAVADSMTPGRPPTSGAKRTRTARRRPLLLCSTSRFLRSSVVGCQDGQGRRTRGAASSPRVLAALQGLGTKPSLSTEWSCPFFRWLGSSSRCMWLWTSRMSSRVHFQVESDPEVFHLFSWRGFWVVLGLHTGAGPWWSRPQGHGSQNLVLES